MLNRIFSTRLFPLCVIILAGMLCACNSTKEKEKTAKKKESGKPQIVAVQEEINFGAVAQGVEVEKVFTVKNQGNAELKIEKAQGS